MTETFTEKEKKRLLEYHNIKEINNGKILLCRVKVPGKLSECLSSSWYINANGDLFCCTCKSKISMQALKDFNLLRMGKF